MVVKIQENLCLKIVSLYFHGLHDSFEWFIKSYLWQKIRLAGQTKTTSFYKQNKFTTTDGALSLFFDYKNRIKENHTSVT